MATQAKQTKKPEPKAPAPPQDEAFDWGSEQATGFEGTRAEDLGIPFISLLQKGSPEVDEGHPDYATKKVEGAKAGFVINTVSRAVLYARDEEQPLFFVPAFHEKLYQEWKPRDSGGGFVRSHPNATILTKCARNEKNQDVLPNGNIIITTSYFSGFALIDDEWIRMILPFQSTQLKKARGWLNMMHSIKLGGSMPPMYSHVYALRTVSESNEKGNWWGWKIDLDRTLNKSDLSVINDARQLAGEAAKGRLALPAATQDDEPEHTSAGGPPDEAADEEASQVARRNRQ